LIPKS
jgi:hypothetical protein